ncbi:MAG TPA: MDR family MFS transporter [Stellaceae bacterium]|nr:MDR family MFS transporter [Stellaceae bacterium]
MDQTVGEARPSVVVPRRGMVLAAALMATFMAAVESTIVATAMPTIVADLGGFRLFSWVFAAYLLTMAVTVPVYGRLADIYGRKRVFFVGTGIFLVGTTLCGFAGSMTLLIVFRAVQGVGAGAIQPVAVTVLGDIYTPAERARVQGYTSSVFGISAIVGPALGAFIVEHLHWALVFWVNLPIGLASMLMFGLFLRENVPRRNRRRIDYLGSALLALGVGSAMLALVQGARLGAVGIAAAATIAAAALVLLAMHEARTPEPIVPFRLWRNRVIALANLGSFGTGAAMMGVSAFLPAYVQGVMGRGPGVAGFALGCQSVSWMLATIVAGRLMVRTSYRLSAGIGAVALFGGGALLVLLTPASGVWLAAGGSFVMGIGMGFCNPAFLVSIQASVGWAERGVATGANMFMRTFGQSFGAALFGAVVNFGVHARVPNAGDAVNKLLQPGLRNELGSGQLARLTQAFAASVHEVYWLVIAIAVVVTAVAALFPPRLSPIRPR